MVAGAGVGGQVRADVLVRAAPAAGVTVVSFFVTARYKGQDDRAAFIDAVMEQLAELLGEPIPGYLTEAARERHLLRMLTEAAEACQRLVLVVDGLDEDRGVTVGPDAYSIAALLPARPPPGLRVIVAGRPDPPVPDDVPDDHPLRDPGIVRVLAASPSAVWSGPTCSASSGDCCTETRRSRTCSAWSPPPGAA